MSDVYKNYKAPEGSGGLYLKFEDGKPVKLRLMTEPYLFTSQFKEGDPITTRYAWVIWNHDENKAQVLQLPITGFRQVQDLAANDEWGDPQGYNITIKRTGSGLETKYAVMPGLKASVGNEMIAAAKAINIQEKIENAIPLAQIVGGAEVPKPAAPASETDSVPVEARSPEGEVDIDSIPF